MGVVKKCLRVDFYQKNVIKNSATIVFTKFHDILRNISNFKHKDFFIEKFKNVSEYVMKFCKSYDCCI